jgi:hypothetical protein
MEIKPFGAFGDIVKIDTAETIDESAGADLTHPLNQELPIENWEPHLKAHGQIWYYPGHGHHCRVDNCDVNQNPKSLTSIFNAIDRNEY